MSGEGGCSEYTFCGQRGFFRCERPQLLVLKNFGFFQIYGVSAQTIGVEPMRTFCGQGGGGKSFAILCGRFFLERT